jgi:ABC-2 type transport system permease protein
MSSLALAARDSRTMLRRSMRRMIRYPSMTLQIVLLPVVFLLLFVYVFGGTLGDGIGGVGGGRTAYVNYVTPGIIAMTAASTVAGIAISVAMDMTEGIIARFKTMAISRASVLTGHVLGSLIQTMIGIAIVIGVALLIGFRPNATVVEWVAAAGLLAGFALALIWLGAAMGLAAKTVESASNSPLLLTFLPFLASGFVPTESLPTALRWFAEYQPFTPVIETTRGLLLGTEIGDSGWWALGWIVVMGVAGYLWAKNLFAKPRVR